MSSSATQPGPPWTVLKLLDWSRDFFSQREIESPRLDAELLLAHVLELDRVRLYMEYDRPLTPSELDAYRALVKRRASREPVAYLTGTRGFWSLDLQCDSRALIPRPDTEVLVEEVLARIGDDTPVAVLDIGTGTGAIALSVKTERPRTHVVATDVDADTLELARTNRDKLDIEIELVLSDLFDQVDGTFDVIASNPPYVADAASVDHEVGHEPQHALFAGADGLDVLRRLIARAPQYLNSGGWLLVEHGFDQRDAVQKLFAEAGFETIETRKDYGGNDRVTSGRLPATD